MIRKIREWLFTIDAAPERAEIVQNDRGGYSIAVEKKSVGNYPTPQAARRIARLNGFIVA